MLTRDPLFWHLLFTTYNSVIYLLKTYAEGGRAFLPQASALHADLKMNFAYLDTLLYNRMCIIGRRIPEQLSLWRLDFDAKRLSRCSQT